MKRITIARGLIIVSTSLMVLGVADLHGQQSAAVGVGDANAGLVRLGTKLFARDGHQHDCFGRSLAMSGDLLVAGAKGDDERGNNSGAVYVFRRQGDDYIQQAKLKAADASINQFFGFSVGISGDTVVVGAWQDQAIAPGAGAAYVFRQSGSQWVQEAKLAAGDPRAYAHFGYSVSIVDDTVLIGAREDGERAAGSGAAYVFQRGGHDWKQVAKLTAVDAAEHGEFGWSVAMAHGTAIVGAYSGSAYVFAQDRDTWKLQAQLRPRVGNAADHFGYAVSIADGVAVVGATDNSTAARRAGAAFVFERRDGQWTEVQQLTPWDAVADEFFGWSVAIGGDTVAVGAFYDTHNGAPDGPFGSAYTFRRTASGWEPARKLMSSKPNALDLFGWTVAISGQTIAVGARLDDEKAEEAGAVYLYQATW